MANTLKFGNGEWYGKKDTILAYNDENNNYKPLPFDFSRGSSATVVNKDGLIETVGSGESRVDYKDNTKGALLLEPSRSNLVTYSSIFSIWTQVNGASASDTTDVISPDGTLNAELLVSGGNGNVQGIYKNISFLNATTYTMSVFAKKKEISFIQLQGGGAGWVGNTFANFDLENGIVGNIGSGAISSSIENYGNGWYRCSFTATKTASGGNLSIDLINSATDGRDASYNGNIGDGVYIYGAQVEEGSYATSYIPTSGSAVTRVAESTIQTPPSGVIGQTEGSVYFEFKDLDYSYSSIARGITLSDGTSTNRIYVAQLSSGAMYAITTGGCEIQETTPSGRRGNLKVALGYKNNDCVLYVNGVLAGVDNSATTPICSKVHLGSFSGTANLNKPYKEVKLYNTRLSNSELQALTSN
jgi:hypothetical protein